MSEYLRAFNDGFIQGYEQMAQSDRILAFGAIRRAAEVARWHDDTYIDSTTTCMVGDCIRDAIRAAIGSANR